MTHAPVTVEGLRKVFRVYTHPRDMVLEVLLGRARHREFLALDDITFEVKEGSVLGIMGRNGAGKSTLLRIIAGTLDATGGRVQTTGRVSAILELGTGFHPGYTARENIFLGGMCLGLGRAEIQRRFDEIVAFSELGDFLDQPFRTFSSGMQARLTFSVATCVDPDVLIVDEALSVGDAKFQLKSFDRIRDFKRRGKVIILVSHNVNQISTICDRAILLEHGRIVIAGEPGEVGNIYHEQLFGPPKRLENTTAADDSTGHALPPAAAEASAGQRYGTGDARIVAVQIYGSANPQSRLIANGDTMIVRMQIEAHRDVADVCIGVIIRSSWGIDLIGTDTRFVPCPGLPASLHAGERVEVTISMPIWLANGTYFLTLGIASVDETKHDMWFDGWQFEVKQASNFTFHNSLICVPISFHATSVSSAS